MSGTSESVVRMANQIAKNFAIQGEEDAVYATAEHINLFWDRRMKEAGFALIGKPVDEDAETGLSDLARAALVQLKDGSHPAA